MSIPKFAAMLIALLLSSCENKHLADQVWLGNIITIDPETPKVEAVAVTNGKIIALGSEDDVMALVGRSTKIHKLGSKTLMPGFVAAHEHPGISAVFSDLIDLSGLTHKTADDMWAALKVGIADTPEGEWVYGMGIDPVLMSDLERIDRELLDSLAPNNPVLLVSQSLHSFWVNSLAYEQVGIDETVQDPETGGHFGRDNSGRLNGFIAEPSTAAPFVKPLRKPQKLIKSLKNELISLNQSGFTTVASLGYNAPPWLAKWVGRDSFKPYIRQIVYLIEDELKYLPASPDNGDEFYRIAGVKLWHDGSPYSGAMHLKEPYLDTHLTAQMGIKKGQLGEPVIDAGKFEALIKTYHQAGWQLAIHSQGDASNEAVMSLMDGLSGNAEGSRHRLEHNLLLPITQLNKMQSLGMTPSFHINHLWYYGDVLSADILGAERAQRLLPIRSAFENELRPTLHADSPMFPADPFSLMATAQERLSRSGMPIAAEEAISAEQALQSMTINGAWQLHMEDDIGSLEVGKFADFVVLSDDPLTLPAHQWRGIRVEQTWLAGRLTF